MYLSLAIIKRIFSTLALNLGMYIITQHKPFTVYPYHHTGLGILSFMLMQILLCMGVGAPNSIIC